MYFNLFYVLVYNVVIDKKKIVIKNYIISRRDLNYQVFEGIFCTQAINRPGEEVFFTNSAGDLLPALEFLSRLHNFCNLVIIFYLM